MPTLRDIVRDLPYALRDFIALAAFGSSLALLFSVVIGGAR